MRKNFANKWKNGRTWKGKFLSINGREKMQILHFTALSLYHAKVVRPMGGMF
jgi:hypothetical protein